MDSPPNHHVTSTDSSFHPKPLIPSCHLSRLLGLIHDTGMREPVGHEVGKTQVKELTFYPHWDETSQQYS